MSVSLYRRQVVAARKRRLFFEPLENRSLLAAVITVNSTLDTNARDSVLTLREAILINNRTLAVASLTAAELAQVVGTPTDSDRDTIGFNIPGSGVQTISLTSSLSTITDSVVIDGYTQPGASPNTNAIDDPNPANRGFNGTLLIQLSDSVGVRDGLTIGAHNSTIRGLVINRFAANGIVLRGDGTSIEGNLIGTDASGITSLGNIFSGVDIEAANNRIGGTTPGARNVISGNGRGVALGDESGVGNVIQGNFIGIDASGTERLGNVQFGIVLFESSNNTIGGTQLGARNIISGNGTTILSSGISLQSRSDANIVQGNFIGVDVTGTRVLGNSLHGIQIAGSNNNVVGGTSAAERNVISGNGRSGVLLSATGISGSLTSTGNTIQGNFIGVDASGTSPIGNSLNGVEFSSSSSNNAVGGEMAGAGNVIAFNGGNGVFLQTVSGLGNAILSNAIIGNSIYSNTKLGIDLGGTSANNGDDVTANDALDPDSGPNNRQNYPVLTSATTSDGNTVIEGTLNSRPNMAFRIEFYTNVSRDLSGFGEGERFFGSINVTTDGSGNAPFAFSGPSATGSVFTATATRLSSQGLPLDTSEFSGALGMPAVCSLVVTNTFDAGTGSLREAIHCANASVGVVDTIEFNIPGTGVHTIRPGSALPAITDPVIIDGYTQPGSARNTDSTGWNGRLLVELSGNNAGFNAHGIHIIAGNSTVRGLMINRFAGDGIYLYGSGSNRIEGNWIGLNSEGNAAAGNENGVTSDQGSTANIIGGSSPDVRNVISGNSTAGVKARLSTLQVIQGNFIGTNALGTTDVGNNVGVLMQRSTGGNLIGGTSNDQRNIISGNDRAGLILVTNSTLQRNFIGTDVTGTLSVGNGDGIVIDRTSGVQSSNTIGDSVAHGNVVSGNLGNGIVILDDDARNTVQGNLIGTGFNGTTPMPNAGHGILIRGRAVQNSIGGTSDGTGNTIAFNGGAGVFVDSPSTGNVLLSNSIFFNSGLGIDLSGGGESGVTLNDSGDGDTGGNNRQNFPLLTSVTSMDGMTTILGTLNSTAGTQFRIEIFSNAIADAAGFGEGRSFFGATNVTTSPNGNASFSFAGPNTSGTVFTATATRMDAQGLLVETSEFSATQTVVARCGLAVTNTLDSGPGSLREAIHCANSTPNVDGPDADVEFDPDVIRFAIPGAGVKTIGLLSPLPVITEGVVIDGYSQPGASVNTLAVGNNAVLMVELNGAGVGSGNGLTIVGGGSTVRGLAINRFAGNGILLQTGGFNAVTGNFIGTDVTGSAARSNGLTGVRVLNSNNNTIGGAAASARNVISGNLDTGVFVVGATSGGNTIAGNYVGVTASGAAALSNSPDGIVVQSPNATIGGDQAGAGNLISGNARAGLVLFSGAVQNIVAGNLIGVNAAGTAALGNGAEGIGIHQSAQSNLIGGVGAGAANVVSGNMQDGIVLFSGAELNTVAGNFVGTNHGGTAAIPNITNGIRVAGGNRNTIGGGNTIAHNLGSGVAVIGNAAVRNAIHGNSIFDNLGLGIDLGGDGMTLNDAGEGDAGPNNLQNFPVITGVTTAGGNTIISGRLQSTPFSLYRLEFFSSEIESTGLGEGQTFLGSINVMTNAAGTVFFTTPGIVGVVPAGRVVTATATTRIDDDQNPTTPLVLGDTSEFSTAICSLIVTTTADSGVGSLREAIRCANIVSNIDRNGLGGADPDPITFAIPGTGVRTITLASPLPEISEAVTIDGYTQLGASVNTLAQGNNAVLRIEINAAAAGAAGVLQITGGSSTVRGLVINRSPGAAIVVPAATGASNRFEGNFLGTNAAGNAALPNGGGIFVATPANVIGGELPGQRNVIVTRSDAVRITGGQVVALGTIVQGNYLGMNAAGTATVPDGGLGTNGVFVGGAGNNTIGGTSAGARNVIGGFSVGVNLFGSAASVNTVMGNYIGTNAEGRGAVANGVGIRIDQGVGLPHNSGNIIGGAVAGAGNVISGNGEGIVIESDFNTIQGNFVGVDNGGVSPLPNSGAGIQIGQNALSNLIGGTIDGAGNVIANNGVGILAISGSGNSFLRNSIHSNVLLGIDLASGIAGMTPNDADDADEGPNRLQNFPEILSAVPSEFGGIVVTYFVPTAEANTTYPLRIEFFRADADGQEGEVFLGVDTFTLDDFAAGPKTILLSPVANVVVGDRLVATATDSRGVTESPNNTSEFSDSVLVADQSVCGLLVTNTNDSGPGSLREAINCANATPNIDQDGEAGVEADVFTFAIPANDLRHFYYVNDGVAGRVSRGSVAVTTAATDAGLLNADPDWPQSWFSIELASALPEITEGVVIDGYTQAGASGNTQEVGSDAVLKVEVSGRADMPVDVGGFFVTGGGSTLRGLIVNRFANLLQGGMPAIVLSSDANFVEGNFIGTDASGTLAFGNGTDGVIVVTGANNHVGGTARSSRNLISGNGGTGSGNGVVVGAFNDGLAAPIGTRILNNHIGTNADGMAALPNLGSGVLLVEGLNTVIGGDDDDDGLTDGVVASRNVISGNLDSGIVANPSSASAFDVIIQGNFVGVDASGTAALPNSNGIALTGDFINDSDAQIGGVTAGAGNVLSGNLSAGLLVFNVQTLNVQGNLIGTDKSGTQEIGNGEGGIWLELNPAAPLDYALTIGGQAPGSGNVISGNGLALGINQFGIRAAGQSAGFLNIQRNLIGTQIDGVTPLPNRGPGIDLARPALVGSLNPALRNVIAYNDGSGVVVREFAQPGERGVAILGNSIFGNGFLGIDLGADGATANDLTPTADVDEGPNRLQNFPVISEATAEGGSLTISYFVPSDPANSTYPIRVEFFRADASGQGQILIGSDEFGLEDFDAGGKTITLSPPVAISPGDEIVATATDSVPAVQARFVGPLAVSAGEPNGTSEFGASFIVEAPVPPVADLSVTKSDGALTAVPGTSVTYTIVVSNAGPADVSGADEIQTVSVSGVFASGYRLTFSNQTTAPIAISANAEEVRDALNALATIGGVGGRVDVVQSGNVYTITFGGTLAGQDVSQLTATAIGNIAVTIDTVEQGRAGAILSDVFPASLTNVSYTSVAAGGASGNTAGGSGNLFDNLRLPAGTSVTYTVTGVVSPAATGTLSNTASVTTPAGITETQPGNNSATDTDALTPRGDLSITKSDGVASVAAGSSVTYTIVVSNAGPSTVTGATVTDLFPAALLSPIFTATASGGASGFSGGSGNIQQSVNLPVNSSITYVVAGTVSAGDIGTLSNTASVTVPAGVSDLNPGNNSAVDIDTIIAAAPNVGLVIGADAHPRGRPVVAVYDSQGVRLREFLVYENNYRGGVRVALGDVTGDGVPEIITAPGKNHAPVIKVFTLDGIELPEYRFLAYAANFKGGVYVAVGDLLGDGLNDIVVTPGSEGRGVNGLRNGGTEVRVYGNQLATSPERPFVDNAPDRQFLAFPKNVVGVQFLGGATVATGDVQPGGKLEVIVGSGPGIRATARAFNVENGAIAVQSWLPFDRNVRGGIFVAAGRIDGDAAADVVFGAWQGSNALVEIRSGATGALLRPQFRPYVGLPRRVGSASGLRVVARDLNGDGVIDRIIAGQGSDGRTKRVIQFGPLDASATDFVMENDADFIGGLLLG